MNDDLMTIWMDRAKELNKRLDKYEQRLIELEILNGKNSFKSEFDRLMH